MPFWFAMEPAGTSGAARWQVPANIALLSLPPYSPGLNPMENVRDYLRQNKLCALVWESDDEIPDACTAAWNRLIDDPARVKPIGARDWAV